MGSNPALLSVSDSAYQAFWQKQAGRFPKEKYDAAAIAGFYVLYPVLLQFLLWVLKSAEKQGHRRLYFLARDGYLMQRAAAGLCEAWNLDIECRYLYTSRMAWRIPEQHLIGERALERICRGGMHVTFADLMRRAGLKETEGRKVAELLPREVMWDRVLSYREIQTFRKPLADCMEFRRLLEQRSLDAFQAAAAYVKQEGLTEEKSCAIVDSGWIGTMQESLQTLLRGMGSLTQAEGYYFGLYSLPQEAERARFHSFYFGPESGALRKTTFSNCLFECIFTAPHGMTLRYERKGGQSVPVTGPDPHPENRKKTEFQIRGLDCYLEAWIQACQTRQEAAGFRLAEKSLQKLLKSLMWKPSREESAYYGSYLFSDEVTEERLEPLAARLGERELFCHHPLKRAAIMLGISKRELPDSGWIEGSIGLQRGIFYQWHRMGAAAYKFLIYCKAECQYRAAARSA